MNITSIKNDIRAMRLALPATVLAFACAGTACDDETSKIGSSLTEGEISISIDTLEFDLDARSEKYDDFDARTGNLLLGNLNVPEYGRLNCSFVSRMLCATSLNLPDSLQDPERVDSCKMIFFMKRGDLVGDSLAPQKISVYNLTRQLPSDITNEFNPDGYYNKSTPLGSASYTASYASRSDSLYSTPADEDHYISIAVPLPKEFGKQIFTDYKNNPSMFAWPETFAQKYPGFFINTIFGKGCMANIFEFDVYIYFWYMSKESYKEDDETKYRWVKTAGNVVPLISSPEVLSSNNIRYEISDHINQLVADGKTVVTTPGGYNASLRFPAEDLIRHYESEEHNLSLISELTFSIPAETIENDFGIGAAPTMMLIKESEVDNFFNKNKIPDNQTSFTATYDSTNKRYRFSSMRSYILDLLDKGEITDEDVKFSIIPVELTTEEVNNYGSVTSYVTKCKPYTRKPTMTRLLTEKAEVVFTFSSQIIK